MSDDMSHTIPKCSSALFKSTKETIQYTTHHIHTNDTVSLPNVLVLRYYSALFSCITETFQNISELMNFDTQYLSKILESLNLSTNLKTSPKLIFFTQYICVIHLGIS